MTAPRSITRSALINILAEGLGLDPHRTTRVRIHPDRIVAEVITDRDDPEAVIPHEGATPRKLVRFSVVEDGATS